MTTPTTRATRSLLRSLAAAVLALTAPACAPPVAPADDAPLADAPPPDGARSDAAITDDARAPDADAPADAPAGVLGPCNPLAADGTPHATLSATRCFADLATARPAAGVIPFELNSPLWSDGTLKRRWLVVPRLGSVRFAPSVAGASDTWGLPDGAVLIKEFAIERTRGDASTRRPIETRFVVLRAGTFAAFTYRWNAAGDDADLLPAAGAQQTYEVRDPASPSAPTMYAHTFPSRSACAQCHNDVAGRVLGVTTRQLNRVVERGGARVNQLRALERLGLFDAPLPSDPDAMPRFADPADAAQPLGERARSYLHANCAHCHRPGGPTFRCHLQFRHEDLAGAEACSGHGVVPGSPEASRVWYRMSRRGAEQMPPVGTALVDAHASALVRDWILAMPNAECAGGT